MEQTLLKRALAALTLALTLAGCSGSTDGGKQSEPKQSQEGPEGPGVQSSKASARFDNQPYEPVLVALRQAGLTICSDDTFGATAAGDYEHHSVSIALALCPSKDPRSKDFSVTSPGLVVIRSFNAQATRDKASGFGDGLVYWAWGDKTISVTESSRPEIVGAVERAMSSLGAQRTLDKR